MLHILHIVRCNTQHVICAYMYMIKLLTHPVSLHAEPSQRLAMHGVHAGELALTNIAVVFVCCRPRGCGKPLLPEQHT